MINRCLRKRARALRWMVFNFILISILFSPAILFANDIIYVYDDLGRLVKEASAGQVIEFSYDEVGNIKSSKKGTYTEQAPTLTSINPALMFPGASFAVTFTGTNLTSANKITTNNTNVTVSIISTSSKQVSATVNVGSSASAGPIIFTLYNLSGSASIGGNIQIGNLSFSPDTTTIFFPGTKTAISASLTPALGQPTVIWLLNSNPSSVSAPAKLTIPATGIVSFSVKGLRSGDAKISSGNASALVHVAEDPKLVSAPVSVYLSKESGKATSNAAVSVYLNTVSGISQQCASASVYRPDDKSSSAAVLSAPASVQKN
jgi:YD repeat-containing protein